MYRSAAATIGFIGSVVVAAVLLVDAIVRGGVATTLLIVPWILLVLWAIYVAVFASTVTTDADGITVQNFLRRWRVPWQEITDLELRYQLVIHLRGGGRVSCFGGPASGRPRRPSADGARTPRAVRDADLIRDDWERAVRGDAPAGPVVRSWDMPALIALIVIVVALGVAIVVAGTGV